MIRVIRIVAMMATCVLASLTWADEFSLDDYQGMRARLGELFQAGELEQAAELLEQALPRFPDHLAANAFNLAYINGQLGRTERGLEVLSQALEQGVWLDVHGLASPAFEVYKAHAEFEDLVKRNDGLRAAAQAIAEPGIKVVLPDTYSPDRKYPLFLALHGGGGNMEAFSRTWKSDTLGHEFITAYLQSSRMVSMTGFNWMEDIDISRQEIRSAYKQLLDEYPIVRGQVIIGGFSAGGVASLEAVMADDIPALGFIVLCPPPPDGFTEQALLKARERGVRGTLMSSEMDPNIAAQREMAALLDSVGLEHEFVVTPDVGHWIPDNLAEMVDRAINHIMEPRARQ